MIGYIFQLSNFGEVCMHSKAQKTILNPNYENIFKSMYIGTSNKVYVELCTIYIQFLGTPKSGL